MRISVITAIWNSADTVRDCLASLAAQSFTDVEHIVIDGASTDGTYELLKAESSQIAKLISEPDDGIYDALNKGIDKAQGDVIGFLHADDVFGDEMALQRVADAFSDPSVGVCYGDLVYVYRENPDRVLRYWKAGEYSKSALRRGWMPPHPTFYVRRSIYERFGGFDTSYRIASDYDCMLRILSGIEGRVAYIPEVQVRMRVGGTSNRSLRNIFQKSKEDYRALRANGVGGLGTLVWKNLSKLGQFRGLKL